MKTNFFALILMILIINAASCEHYCEFKKPWTITAIKSSSYKPTVKNKIKEHLSFL